MTYFQNPFPYDFRGIWTLADRQHSSNFSIPRNAGRGDEVLYAWAEPTNDNTYKLDGTDADGGDLSDLTFVLAYNQNDYKNWVEITVDVEGATAAATTVIEIAALLNADSSWSSYFTATVSSFDNGLDRLFVKQKFADVRMHSFVRNTGAETILKFNARAGVAELPTYFHRHIVFADFDSAEQLSYTDGVNQLIELDPDAAGGSSDVDDDVIADAVDSKGNSLGLDPSAVQGDWSLLQGGSGLFTFTSGPSSNAVSTTETVLEYPAGAVVGDLGKQTVTQFDASSDIIAIFELPYTLTSSDLITPP